MNQKSTIEYPMQFAILLLLLGLFLVLSAFLVPLLGSMLLHVPFMQVLPAMNKPENANYSRFLNTLASLLAFLLPALILARVINKRPFSQLGFHATLSYKQLGWIFIITFASMVLSGALGELNEKFPIPVTWYAKAKVLEETYKAAMITMATMKTPGEYLLALLVLAVAPAIFEEVLFRGGFQQIFIGWTKSNWKGIFITSIIFSAIHFSYFGFLPRLALGIVLGLIFLYSKNIWLSIALHFLNNAFVVTQLYMVSRQGRSIEKTLDESMPIWWGAVAIVFLLIFFKKLKKESEFVLLTKGPKLDAVSENMFTS